MISSNAFVRVGGSALLALCIGLSPVGGSPDTALAAKAKAKSSSKTKLNAPTINGQAFLCYYPSKKGQKPFLTPVSANSKKLSGSNSKFKSPVAIAGANQTDIGGWECK
ncbi:MAG: hypothetical protein ACKVVP_02950 [Chloroflexota bacterium]